MSQCQLAEKARRACSDLSGAEETQRPAQKCRPAVGRQGRTPVAINDLDKRPSAARTNIRGLRLCRERHHPSSCSTLSGQSPPIYGPPKRHNPEVRAHVVYFCGPGGVRYVQSGSLTCRRLYCTFGWRRYLSDHRKCAASLRQNHLRPPNEGDPRLFRGDAARSGATTASPACRS